MLERSWPLAHSAVAQGSEPHTPPVGADHLPRGQRFEQGRVRSEVHRVLTPAAILDLAQINVKGGGAEVAEKQWLKLRQPLVYCLRTFIQQDGRPEVAMQAVVTAFGAEAPAIMGKLEEHEREMRQRVPRPHNGTRAALRKWVALSLNLFIIGIDLIIIPDHQPRDQLDRIKRGPGDSLIDVAVKVERAWMAIVHSRVLGGPPWSKYEAYAYGGDDALIEVHSAYERALRAGPPETAPEQLANYARGKLKSLRTQIMPGSNPEDCYNVLSIVCWASAFDPSEEERRTTWLAAAAFSAGATVGPARRPRPPAAPVADESAELVADLRSQLQQANHERANYKNQAETLRAARAAAGRSTPKEVMCAMVGGERKMINFTKLYAICQSNPRAATLLRGIGAPTGEPGTWEPVRPTVPHPDGGGRFYNSMQACDRCMKHAGTDYRQHNNAALAAVGAGHDPRYCQEYCEDIAGNDLLSPALETPPLDTRGKGGKGAGKGAGKGGGRAGQ